jgi:hypothetical protein
MLSGRYSPFHIEGRILESNFVKNSKIFEKKI